MFSGIPCATVFSGTPVTNRPKLGNSLPHRAAGHTYGSRAKTEAPGRSACLSLPASRNTRLSRLGAAAPPLQPCFGQQVSPPLTHLPLPTTLMKGRARRMVQGHPPIYLRPAHLLPLLCRRSKFIHVFKGLDADITRCVRTTFRPAGEHAPQAG